MAARAKRGAAVAAARSVGEEGGGWLCRVYGRSPAEGALVVYALLPRLPTPSSLGRLATVLSGDPRFEAREAVAERLPFAVAGYAVVGLGGGRVYDGIPEEARGALEGHRARRLAVVALTRADLRLEELAGLRGALAELGAGVRIRPLAPYVVFELLPQRPLAPEERERLRGLIGGMQSVGETAFGAERELLERAGLWALAWMAPELWWDRWGPESWIRAGSSELDLRWGAAKALGRLLPRRADGERGWVWRASDCFRLFLREVGDRELGLMGELVEADEAVRRWERGQRELARRIREAEERARERLGLPLYLVRTGPVSDYVDLFAGDPTRLVLEEGGGKVRVHLHPEVSGWVREELAEELGRRGLAPEDYLRALSEELGREVEIAGDGPPLPPELAEAVARARRALAELIGAGQLPAG